MQDWSGDPARGARYATPQSASASSTGVFGEGSAKQLYDPADVEQVLVSDSVKDLTADSDIAAFDDGIDVLMGAPGARPLYRIEGP
jgi:hypothetical protein